MIFGVQNQEETRRKQLQWTTFLATSL